MILEIEGEGSVGSLISVRMFEVEGERPHLAGGLSQHGSCLLKQILNKIEPAKFDAYGVVTPGSALHEYIQNILLPSGIVLKDEDGEDKYLIIGHEQYVFHLVKGRPHRRSPIDTLVFNLQSREYEIWDWKSTSIGGTASEPMKYLRSLSVVYRSQVNIYGYLFMKAWKLAYRPICKVIFFNKRDWTHSKEFEWRTILKYGEKSIEDIETVQDVYNNFDSKDRTKEEWLELATGRNRWSDTKKKYLKECKYCEHTAKCRKLTGEDLE